MFVMMAIINDDDQLLLLVVADRGCIHSLLSILAIAYVDSQWHPRSCNLKLLGIVPNRASASTRKSSHLPTHPCFCLANNAPYLH